MLALTLCVCGGGAIALSRSDVLLARGRTSSYAPRMHLKTNSSLAAVLAAGILFIAAGCQEEPDPSASLTDASEGLVAKPSNEAVQSLGRADASSNVVAEVAKAKRHPSERPLPAFSGVGLDGRSLSISSFIGKRLVLFFYNPDTVEAGFAGDAIAEVAKLRQKNNFNIVGVAMGASHPKAARFANEKLFDFQIFDDSGAAIAGKLGVRSPAAIYGFDEEGYFEFGMGYFTKDAPDPAGIAEDQLRENLRLPKRVTGTAGQLDPRPTAPMFSANQLDLEGDFDLASIAGKPTVLIFFLHTCPHCHAALEFLKEQLAKLPEAQRPELVAVSAANRPSAVREMVEQQGLEGIRIVFDRTGDIMETYGVFAGFPDVFLIDKAGKIVHRTQGWRKDRDPALNRMIISKIVGAKVPMLLNPKGYTGSDVCSVCHELEGQSYEFTRHATAYNTIVTHNETRNEECVSCHVVGFNQPGGYSFNESPAHLENVGCESCHGRGGPHLSPDFVPKDGAVKNYESVCQTCHNPTHSISFDYATFRPKISHVAIAQLTNEERAALLGDDAKPRDVLPKNADYVGSTACQSCHPSEFKTWSESPHNRAVETLAAKGKQDDATCLKCHTTGMGRRGGFPKNGKGEDPAHADFASVGCESCHGPGGNHIAPSAKKLGTIVSLADKCDSCAILQICGSCHDDANDPGFEFRVEERIERQRHGTIEAGTGKPLSDKPTAQRDEPARPVEGAVAHVLRTLDSEG